MKGSSASNKTGEIILFTSSRSVILHAKTPPSLSSWCLCNDSRAGYPNRGRSFASQKHNNNYSAFVSSTNHQPAYFKNLARIAITEPPDRWKHGKMLSIKMLGTFLRKIGLIVQWRLPNLLGNALELWAGTSQLNCLRWFRHHRRDKPYVELPNKEILKNKKLVLYKAKRKSVLI